MAFCTNCGSVMDDNARFCVKCGKAVTPAAGAAAASAPASAPAAAGVPAPAPAQKSGGALKIVLIILAILLIIGAIIAGVVGYGIYKLKKSVNISQSGDSAVIETPYGKFGGGTLSSSDAAEQLGVDLYPGAEQEGDAASGTLGNTSTVSITLMTSDTVDQVAQFYKSRYPKAMTTSTDGNFTLVAGDKTSMLTINAEDSSGRTKITIAKITGSGNTEASE